MVESGRLWGSCPFDCLTTLVFLQGWQSARLNSAKRLVMIENNDPTTEEYYVLFRDCSNQVLRDGNNGNPVCDLLPNDIASYVWWHLGKLTKFEQQATGVLIFQEFLEKFVKTPKKQNITTPRDSNIVYPKKSNRPPYVPPSIRSFARIAPLPMLVKIWRDNGCASPEVILRATAVRLMQLCADVCVEHDEIFVKEWKSDWEVTKLVLGLLHELWVKSGENLKSALPKVFSGILQQRCIPVRHPT